MIISIHLGTDDQGQRRKAALEKLAEKYGLIWNDGPSIGRLVVKIADGKIELKESNMDRYDDDRNYSKAEKRINETPELEPYRETILYDWQDSGEHWDWIATANTQDIINWAQSVEKDQADQERIESKDA